MSSARDSLTSVPLVALDPAATIELCGSLADYGEAGGLSHSLMLRVGSYAETCFGNDAEVLLAAGRMYLFGGESQRARDALIRASSLAEGDTHLIGLLRELLALADPQGHGVRATRSFNEAARTRTVPKFAKPTPRPPATVVTSESQHDSNNGTRQYDDTATQIRLLDPSDERQKLGPFDLIAEIASGGMATVFLARRQGALASGGLLAIKLLHRHLTDDRDFVDMFLDEGRLAGMIDSAHVVRILEAGHGALGHYLVMAYVEGDTLHGLSARARRAGEARLPPAIAIRIALDALAGLHASHELRDGQGRPLGLVHRDATPHNLLVGVDGIARLTDFGVARAASRRTISRPRQVKGKFGYLSPEQARAEDVDRRSDVFTMGVVLWEALTGRPLFKAETDHDGYLRIGTANPPPLRSVVSDLPQGLDDVCRGALQRDKARRYRTAAEMAVALERAAQARGGPGIASRAELGAYVKERVGHDALALRLESWMAARDRLAAPAVPTAAEPQRRVLTPTTRPPPTQLTGQANAGQEVSARRAEPHAKPPTHLWSKASMLLSRIARLRVSAGAGVCISTTIVAVSTMPFWLPALRGLGSQSESHPSTPSGLTTRAFAATAQSVDGGGSGLAPNERGAALLPEGQ